MVVGGGYSAVWWGTHQFGGGTPMAVIRGYPYAARHMCVAAIH